MADFASEAGHWYAKDGTPRYTIVGANGKERPTTLRDARKLDLIPSVTGIIRMAAAPALEKWKRNQVLLAALTLPRDAGETESDWLARVEQDWQEQGRAAAEKGTRIHAAIEQHYRKQIPDEDLFPWVKAAADAISDDCGRDWQWAAERSFASDEGYGGKLDLHCLQWVVDVKTKDGTPTGDLFEEHYMQAAAYRHGVGYRNARCGILFVSRTAPMASFVEIEESDLKKGWAMFRALLDFWYAKNGLAR